MDADKTSLIELTAHIVSAYAEKNRLPPAALVELIGSVNRSLIGLSEPKSEPRAEPVPAVPVKKSVTPDYIVSLENGQKFKSLRRHLMTAYGMTPADYRAKWNLPADYPMVAPNYASTRSELAKKLGLGRKRTTDGEPAAAPAPAGPPKKRGRPRKVVDAA